MKKVVIKHIVHHNEKRYAIVFEYNKELVELIRSICGVRWSQSKGCWHSPEDENILHQILEVLKGKAEIDATGILAQADGKAPVQVIPTNELPDKRVKIAKTLKIEKSVFAPVLFTISENEGKLVIKFTGRYDKEWITELKTFGKPYYNNVTRDWHLGWTQLAVDSLSDYFYSRGVDVIVKKKAVSSAIAERRNEQANKIRERCVTKEVEKGIENVRKKLEERRFSKRTIESYIAGMEVFFKYFNNKEPEEIAEEDVTEFIEAYILMLGYSASYQNIIISAIKNYFKINNNRLLDTGSLKRPKKSRALPKVFSKKEIMEIFSATRNQKHKLILWLIYSCGLRRSEVINIKLTDLERDRGVLHIREAKGNIDRMVPIPLKVWEKISVYINEYKPGIYLFEGQKGGKYSAESVYAVFKHSLKLAGIMKDVGVHSLRHSYATHLHEGGLDIRYIQALLGHKSSRTTEIYTHISRRNLFSVRSPIEDMEID